MLFNSAKTVHEARDALADAHVELDGLDGDRVTVAAG